MNNLIKLEIPRARTRAAAHYFIFDLNFKSSPQATIELHAETMYRSGKHGAGMR